jgi:hypothetical protein
VGGVGGLRCPKNNSEKPLQKKAEKRGKDVFLTLFLLKNIGVNI